jgi:hypothetical protein
VAKAVAREGMDGSLMVDRLGNSLQVADPPVVDGLGD